MKKSDKKNIIEKTIEKHRQSKNLRKTGGKKRISSKFLAGIMEAKDNIMNFKVLN